MSETKSCCRTSTVPDERPAAAGRDAHRQSVREAYARVAKADSEGQACGVGASCCGTSEDGAINALISTRLGYSQADLDRVPSVPTWASAAATRRPSPR